MRKKIDFLNKNNKKDSKIDNNKMGRKPKSGSKTVKTTETKRRAEDQKKY